MAFTLKVTKVRGGWSVLGHGPGASSMAEGLVVGKGYALRLASGHESQVEDQATVWKDEADAHAALERWEPKRGPGRPPIDAEGGGKVPIMLSRAQRAEAEAIAEERELQGVAGAVRYLLDESAAKRAKRAR